MQELDDIERTKREVAADRHPGDDIRKLHCMGYAPSEISPRVGLSARDVRYHITAIWFDENHRKTLWSD